MRTIAILDCETTGLNPETDACIEVAVVLYSVEHAAPIASFSSLIYEASNAAEDVNRIPAALLGSGVCPVSAKVWPMVGRMIAQADAVVAHRAEFDRAFVDATVRDVRPWVCSKFDIEWPKGKPGDHLVNLALSHGLGVVHAHRALTDCDILTRLFMRVAEMGHDVSAMLARAMLPRVSVLSLAPFAEKDIVKAHGFEFNSATREWTKRCIKGEVPEFPFQTRVLE
jgi:DNA polymerase-3 subunit epsilon